MAGGVLAPLLWLALCAGTGITAVRAATERVIYRFQGGADGAVPLAGLTSIGGTLYGTTEEGGINCDVGCGTVFALAPPAVPGGAWTETVIYRFTGYYDGALPEAGLVAIGGTLYGTTLEGGRAGGTVFALLPPQSGGTAWTENVLCRVQRRQRWELSECGTAGRERNAVRDNVVWRLAGVRRICVGQGVRAELRRPFRGVAGR